jgi:hypothetical protein
MCGFLNNVTVSGTDVCKISTNKKNNQIFYSNQFALHSIKIYCSENIKKEKKGPSQ